MLSLLAITSVVLWTASTIQRLDVTRHLAEERFIKAFRCSPDGASIVRLRDWTVLEVNQSWESTFGYTAAETIGKPSTDLKLLVHPEQRKHGIDQLQRDGFTRDLAVQVRQKSGAVRDVTVSTEMIEIEGEKCLLSIYRDITDRKRADESCAKVSRVPLLGGGIAG